MPISGIFFVPLHHQSKRKTMFKKTDPNPQLDMFTAPVMQLGNRASYKYSTPVSRCSKHDSHYLTTVTP